MLSMVLNEVVAPPPPPPDAAAASTVAAAPAPKFSTYLMPSFSRPFRRHHVIATSTSRNTTANAVPTHNDIPSLSNSPTDSTPSSPAECSPASDSPSWFSHVKNGLRRRSTEQSSAPRLTRIQPDTIRCSTCGTDFAFYSQIVSKGFTGRYGRAYLVAPPDGLPQKSGANLINIKVGKPENRVLVTGQHVVADIQCATCRAKIGWKYIDAKEESQKYKIGKFILENQRTVDYRNWDDATADEIPGLEFEQEGADSNNTDFAMFDLDDSDDCEDLFLGIWDAKTSARRHKLKLLRRWK
ncbi:yippee-domain-containing protein [Xylaria curta]|nr:yippee-domain-containing protein [Xylaria curta]